MHSFSRALVWSALVVALCAAGFGIANSSPLPVQHDAWTGNCEGCDNGNVVLDFDGVNRAVVFGLKPGADPGVYVGTGSVEYVAQGLSINDQAAQFRVELVDSPTKDLIDPVTGRALCPNTTKIVSSVSILGSLAAYTIVTSNFQLDLSAKCAQGRYDYTVDPKPHAAGRLKKSFQVGKDRVVTLSGRIVRRN